VRSKFGSHWIGNPIFSILYFVKSKIVTQIRQISPKIEISGDLIQRGLQKKSGEGEELSWVSIVS
jgi:hypothetical protein